MNVKCITNLAEILLREFANQTVKEMFVIGGFQLRWMSVSKECGGV